MCRLAESTSETSVTMTYFWCRRLGISLLSVLFIADFIVALSDTPVIELTSLTGKAVALMCNLTKQRYDPDWTFQDVNGTLKSVAHEGHIIEEWKTKANISKSFDMGDVTLMIFDVQVEDAGIYQCIENAGEGPRHSFRLNVTEMPTYTSTYILREGFPVILPCVRSNGRGGRWQWRQPGTGISTFPREIARNGSLLNGWRFNMSEINHFFPGDFSLTVFNTTRNSSGIYTCIVRDGTKYQYTLNISGSVAEEATKVTSIETSSWLAAFVCQFPNTSRVRWYRKRPNGWDSLFNGHNVVNVTEQSGRLRVYNSAPGSSVLFIHPTIQADTGRYRCSPWNINQISNQFDLIVKGKTISATNGPVLTTTSSPYDRRAVELLGMTHYTSTTNSPHSTKADAATETSHVGGTKAEHPVTNTTLLAMNVVVVMLLVVVVALIVLIVLIVSGKDKKIRTRSSCISRCNGKKDQRSTAQETSSGLRRSLLDALPMSDLTMPSVEMFPQDKLDGSSAAIYGQPKPSDDLHEIKTRELPLINTVNKTGRDVRGACVIGDRLFVVRDKQSHIDVYNAQTMEQLGRLPVSGGGSRMPCCMASDASKHSLYITYHIAKIVRRVLVSDKNNRPMLRHIKEWYVNSEPDGIAVMASHNVLVVLTNECRLVEFEPNGRLIKTITLESPVCYPHCAMICGSDRLLVCYGLPSTDRGVCLVKSDGKVVRHVQSKTNMPIHAVLGPNGSVLIAGFCDNKVVMLDEKLSYLCDVVNREISEPYRLCYEDECKKLYVGEFIGSSDLCSFPVNK